MTLPGVDQLHSAPAARLRDALREQGIDSRLLRAMTESEDNLRCPLAPTRETSLLDTPAAVMVRLLFCCQAEGADQVREALGHDLVQAMRASGLLAGEGRLTFPFHLRMAQSLYLLSDFLDGSPDAVMGAGETTAILYRAGQPRRRVARSLDLGCGAGTLALLLAADSDFVVGTDVNTRAVEVARFNAALNGITNVDFRAGDMYEPVAGERFDVILSRPPYYPNRRDGSGEVFLHGGEFGDELSHRVVAGIPEHLSADGQAVLFTSWPEGRQANCPDGFQLIELSTNRRELHGTRQSLNVFRRGARQWVTQSNVPADSWGFIRAERIEEMFAAEALLRNSQALWNASLRLPARTRVLEEGDQVLLQGTPESLIGLAPVDEAMWQTIAAVNKARTVGDALQELKGQEAGRTLVERAVRRGLLVMQRGP